ncbi:ATP-binding protein [Streptomyces sp. NPDC058691]|uniref:sensor histidine kinase n=1 Tax=Streptomyces sp. NPDC058691 TaxID=3346601 RepID=UPI00365B4108
MTQPDVTAAPGARHGRPGKLKVFLGAAPGVGKTYRMLDEARRRAARGTDVVVGYVECHKRPNTEAKLEGLEVVPRVERRYRGADFTEMDLDAVLARAPQVALVDEMAHTNIPGGAHAKRWQDIEDLLAAGIDVITAVNIQHLESLNDVVEKITGVPQRETLPDEVVRRADEIELVDMPAEALRRRMAHGNVYAPEKVDAALSNYFRVGNLTALRELALLWVAGRVDEALQKYRTEHGIGRVWETRERVVVALTGGPEGETLIRRAARIAERSSGGGASGAGGTRDLLAVHIARSDGLADSSPAALSRQRALVESLGGSFHSVVGDHVPTALLEFARAENATQLVVGVSRRGRLSRFVTGRGVGETIVERSGDIDVHMVSHERAGRGRLLPTPSNDLPFVRKVSGPVAGFVLPALLTVVLANTRGHLNLTSEALLFLLTVVGVACIGGVVSALLASVTASLLLNYFFIPPIGRFTIGETNNVLALAVFAVVAVTVATIVDRSLRLGRRAAGATAEAETLSSLAGNILRGDQAVEVLLQRTREAFGLESAELVHGPSRPGRLAVTGRDEAGDTVSVTVGPQDTLVLRGRRLAASERRVLVAFAGHVASALERARLAEAAAEVEPVKAADRMRTALLAAVGHDLRTPLAGAWAAISSLRSREVEFSTEDRDELLTTAEESLARLSRLVDNLLDMSRLQAGALRLTLRPTAFAEVVPLALDSLADTTAPVVTQGLDEAPLALADPPLVERVVANLVTNAQRHAPEGTMILVGASALGGRVELRVADRGPGLPPADWERVFEPFQRLGDTDNTTGLGLGLALSRGLTEAMGGTLTPEDTPGGGLTMVLSLPVADAPEATPSLTPGDEEALT